MKALWDLVKKPVGWVLLVVGIAALPLPGPGALIILLAVLVLSQSYEWADRRLDSVKAWALKGAADSVQSWPRILASLVGVAWLVGFGTYWVMQPPKPAWWALPDWSWLPYTGTLPDWTWLPGGVFAGATLIFSGVVALAILVYSWVKFRNSPAPEAEAERAVHGEVD
ncbi:hypothetical protein GCM10009737_21450 [Nocardioides lentus]|uniref:TIGR02611 family protein n=1 Tax=Nocardioides lentus TaxID=338077 RepID=A0ABN2PF92_9ACTN